MQTHKYDLGTVVEVEVSIRSAGDGGIEVDLNGTCRLAVVGHLRGSAQEPLYVLSDLAVKYPFTSQDWTEYRSHATVVELGYAEEDLHPTGKVRLDQNVEQWLARREDLKSV